MRGDKIFMVSDHTRKKNLEATVLGGTIACGRERLLMHLYHCSQAHHIQANVEGYKHIRSCVYCVYDAEYAAQWKILLLKCIPA